MDSHSRQPTATPTTFPADTLTAEDRRRLRELAELLWADRAALAREWTDRLLATLPDAFRRGKESDDAVLYASNLGTLETVLGHLRHDDAAGLYDAYYRATCQLIATDLERGPAARISLDRLYLSARVSLIVLRERLGTAGARLYDAYVKLTNHLLMVLGKAYCDTREGYVRRVFEQMNTLAHEVRGPLAHIFGQLELLREGAFGPLTAKQGEVLDELARSAEDLLWLYTGTLELSRLEAGFARLRIEPVAGEHVARQAAGECDAERKRVRIEAAADVPPVHTDRVKLRQILVNLLRNALRWGEGAPVVLRVRRAGDGAVFEVEDHGPGIPSGQREAIFELFRTGNACGLASDGYGIGLHVVRQLARLLGARVEVWSHPGQGTRVRVNVPPVPPDRPHARPAGQ